MSDNAQQRHKPPVALEQPRELLVVCPPMRSNVNLSRIVRAAGCSGVRRIVCCGNGKLVADIARDAGQSIQIETHRTLLPVLDKLKREGYHLTGLEQTAESVSLYDYRFARKTALVVGNERLGIEDEMLRLMDDLVEIPVYGLPYAHNVATATAIALYEYCRQYPRG